MNSCLIIGDLIFDRYRFFSATRICPEAPVPVLVEEKHRAEERVGGAGLVVEQLKSLEVPRIMYMYGSESIKTRLFAGGHLVARIDEDSVHLVEKPHEFEKKLVKCIKKNRDNLKAIVFSDYGKGTFTQPMAERLVKAARILGVTTFVDAKHNWSWYKGADFAFPNQHETVPPKTFKHVIQKLGDRGSAVDGVLVTADKRVVMDTTGAGDVYLAAFVYGHILGSELLVCAEYANMVAGKSVEFLGTRVVKKEEV